MSVNIAHICSPLFRSLCRRPGGADACGDCGVEQVEALAAWQMQRCNRLLKCPACAACQGCIFRLRLSPECEGAHLIEINTNAGGAFLNALLIDSLHDVTMPGEVAALDDLEQVFLEMFRNEWRLERGAAPLQTIAIVDEQPQQQYLYPEFILAQRMFERAGITALIADPWSLNLARRPVLPRAQG